MDTSSSLEPTDELSIGLRLIITAKQSRSPFRQSRTRHLQNDRKALRGFAVLFLFGRVMEQFFRQRAESPLFRRHIATELASELACEVSGSGGRLSDITVQNQTFTDLVVLNLCICDDDHRRL